MTEPFRVLCADPPWKFGDSLPGPKRGAVSHYRCLTVEEIAHFPLPPLANDCVLFLWRVGSMQLEALAVIEAWGFSMPKSELVWLKTTDDGTRLRMGMGRSVRNCHEICLIAHRGKPKRLDAGVLSAFGEEGSGPEVFDAPRGPKHSTKPDKFYEIVERLYPGPRVELFARRRRVGWTCLGDELQGAAE
jgi:N6-adenosine-specific RNA methylase IME4